MKTLKKYVLGAALVSVAALTGCKDKMVELNTNPAIVTTADVREEFFGATRFYLHQGQDTPSVRMQTLGQMMQYFTNSTIYGHEAMNLPNPWPSKYWSDNLYGGGTFGPLVTSLIRTIDREYSDDMGKQMYGEIRAIAKLLYIYQVWMNLDATGTIVYTEGFKDSEGVAKPKYDLYEDVYKQLIDEVKTEVIDVLKEPASPYRVSLGRFDSFYGFTIATTPGVRGSVVAERNNADEQRSLWLRFANTFRLKMGHRVYNVDAATFQAVLTDYSAAAAADQVMTSNAHNCMMLYGWDDENFNNMDWAPFTTGGQRATLGFVNSLKVLKDPRAPLLVKTNFMDTTFNFSTDYTAAGGQLINTNSGINGTDYALSFEYMWTHFPDSLLRFGDMMKMGNVYQGMSANPFAGDKSYNQVYSRVNEGKVVRASTYQFEMKNPNYNADPSLSADYISPSPNNYKGEVSIPKTQEYARVSIFIPSMMQIRYFLRLGGNHAHYLDVPQPRVGGGTAIDGEIRKTVRTTTYLMSYSEHCFRMAMIALDGFNAGQSAQAWFEAGIRANMEQLYKDALRVWVPVVWSADYPAIRYVDASGSLIEGQINGTLTDSVATVTPYEITSGMIDTYITSIGAVDKEKLGVQAWIGMYQQPEEAWAFWKQTGYPKMLEIKPYTTSGKDVVLPSVPGMEKPYLNAGVDFALLQRRAIAPQPNTENNANYNAMQDAFEAAEWFEGTSYEDVAGGRAWWDQNNPDYVVE